MKITCKNCNEAFDAEEIYRGCKRPCPSCGEKCEIPIDYSAVVSEIDHKEQVKSEVPELVKFAALISGIVGIVIFFYIISRSPLVAFITLAFYSFFAAGIYSGKKWAMWLFFCGALWTFFMTILNFGTSSYPDAWISLAKLLLFQIPVLVVAFRNAEAFD